MSNESKFKSLMLRAEALFRSDRPDYYSGYQRGLRRAYHGDRFGTEDEHELWLSLVERRDHTNQERGDGYLAGLAAMDDDDKPGTPDAAAIRAFLQKHGITGSQAARMAHLSGSNKIRAYTGGDKPSRMGGAVWFALHAHVMLSLDQISEIESAMEADLNPE